MDSDELANQYTEYEEDSFADNETSSDSDESRNSGKNNHIRQYFQCISLRYT